MKINAGRAFAFGTLLILAGLAFGVEGLASAGLVIVYLPIVFDNK